MECRYTEAGYKWEPVTYEKLVFEDVDKMRIVSEYYQGHEQAASVVKRYKLSSKQVLFSRMDKYLREESLSLSDQSNEAPMSNQDPEERIKALEAENRRLEKALALEKLRAKAYDTMIEVAEETFNIPIRKKFGTKR